MIGYLVLVLSLSMTCESKFNGCQEADHVCQIADMPDLELAPCCPGFECKTLMGSDSQDKYCVETEAVQVGGKCGPTHAPCASGAKCSNGMCILENTNRRLRRRR